MVTFASHPVLKTKLTLKVSSPEKLFSVISVLSHERVFTSPDSGVTFHSINIDELTRQMKQITFTKQS